MIEFFFDCSSPWTYLAFHNIQPLAAELNEPIEWKPVLAILFLKCLCLQA
jgi:2-hydroxychromene-2-carboxylate isomerase